MKQQTFIICVLASLAFGCEISHPIDPEIVECKIAGGTWKDSKCICPPDIAASTNQTVCRDGKIYTCSNGLLNLVTQCPGECSDNGKLCNLETGGDGDVCYSDKDEQTSLGYLYSCENGKCKLKTICPLGCNDEEGHENECKKCEDKSVMCQDEYLKTCINGYWDSGVKCPNGCDKEQKICNSKEGYSLENTKCDGGYLETYYVYQNEQSELKERTYCYNGCSVNNGVAECISCEPNELACDGNVLKICNENNVWVDKETCPWECNDGACTCETNQRKCENNTLYICNDGQWNKLEYCGEKGCDETGKSCKQTSDNSENSCKEETKECIDNNHNLRECINGQWEITNCGNKGCFNGACGECEWGRSDICNGNTLEKCVDGTATRYEYIECAFGCSNDTCNPCHDKTKCEDSVEYQCDKNGAWEGQFDATLCPNGCDNAGEKCAEKCTDGQTTEKSYFEWYKIVKNNETNLSHLNSLLMDTYSFICLNNETAQQDKTWAVFEFQSDALNSRFVIISKNTETGWDLYMIDNTEARVHAIETAEYSGFCDYVNAQKQENKLIGKLLYRHNCEIPDKDYKTVKTCLQNSFSKIEYQTENEIPFDIIGTCNNGEWTRFEIEAPNQQIFCP